MGVTETLFECLFWKEELRFEKRRDLRQLGRWEASQQPREFPPVFNCVGTGVVLLASCT